MRPGIFLLAALLTASAGAAPPAAPPAPTTLAQASSFIGTALNVVDLDREIRFYTEALGLKVAATLPLGTRTETILRFDGNPGQASLLLMHDTAPGAPKSLDQGAAFSRLVIRVVDVAAMAERLDRLGYAHDAVRNGGHSALVMMMRDPEGFKLEIVQVIPATTGH